MFRRTLNVSKTLSHGLKKLAQPARLLSVKAPIALENPYLRLRDEHRFQSKTIQNLASPQAKHLTGVVLDWSGTLSDIFVIAPAYAFVVVFKKHGVDITMEEARVPMGLRKDLHIQALTKMDSVREKWKAVHGVYPDPVTDTAKLFEDFIPIQDACISEFSGIIPGADEITKELENKYGLVKGLTTGFIKKHSDMLRADAEKQGCKLHVTVAGDELENQDLGVRPLPFMVWKNMERMAKFNPDCADAHRILKVDDTVAGVGEGLNAGTWTAGLWKHSNYMNINSYEQYQKLLTTTGGREELNRREMQSFDILQKKSGCHYLIPDATHLPAVIEDINYRLSKGESPSQLYGKEPKIVVDNSPRMKNFR